MEPWNSWSGLVFNTTLERAVPLLDPTSTLLVTVTKQVNLWLLGFNALSESGRTAITVLSPLHKIQDSSRGTMSQQDIHAVWNLIEAVKVVISVTAEPFLQSQSKAWLVHGSMLIIKILLGVPWAPRTSKETNSHDVNELMMKNMCRVAKSAPHVLRQQESSIFDVSGNFR